MGWIRPVPVTVHRASGGRRPRRADGRGDTGYPHPVQPQPVLDLGLDGVSLTAAICDVPSVSGNEKALADAVEAALRAVGHLEVLRDGDAVLARTHLGRPERVVLAGHLDTVPNAA